MLLPIFDCQNSLDHAAHATISANPLHQRDQRSIAEACRALWSVQHVQ
jgi:hypothetical protein